MDSLTLICSSGLVSLGMTALTLFIGLGKYKQKVDTHGKSILTLQDEMKKCTNKIAELIGSANAKAGGMVQAFSPLTLTEKGARILNESGGKNYIDKNRSFFIKEIQKMNPKSPYDVQEESKEVINSHKNDDDFTVVKNYAYKNGLELEHIIIGMMVYLRDFALTEVNFDIENK